MPPFGRRQTNDMTRTLAIELFKEMVSRPDHGIDLASAALLIALDEYPNLNVQKYLCRIDTLASKIRAHIDFPVEDRPMEAIETINRYLFQTEGFHGNLENYYDPRNSFLNDVLDRRTGIPITLSLVYMEIGKRIGLNLQGVGMPGHFILKYQYRTVEIFVDPFRQGEILFVEECKKRLQQTYGEDFQFDPSFLSSVSKHQILTRMLTNLKGIYLRNKDYVRALSIIEKLLLINPDTPNETRDRAAVHYKLGNLSSALADWASYLELQPEAPDSDEIKNYLKVVGQLLAMRN
jgi:regulator of sirC expression with transglutaminase-like and TPR domain